MNDLFDTIIKMNIYASIAIISVLVFRVLLKKLPKKYICLLWAIVAIRLICPIGIESKFSALNLKVVSNITKNYVSTESSTKGTGNINAKQYSPEVTNRNLASKSKNDSANASKALNETSAGKVAKTAAFKEYVYTAKSFIFSNIATIWFAVMLMLLSNFLLQYKKLALKLKKSKLIKYDGYTTSDCITTPFVLGIIKPTIYLPVGMNDDEKKYILLHEKTHIKNKDYITKFLSTIILCVNWFNPLIWVSYKLLTSDLEMRCDEEVMENLNSDIKDKYCVSLVMNALESKDVYKAVRLSFAQKSFGEMEVRMRIKNLFTKKVSKSIAVFAIIGAVGVTGAISAQAKNSDKSQTTTKVKENKIEVNVTDTDTDIDTTTNRNDEILASIDNEAVKKYAKQYAEKGYYLDDSIEFFYDGKNMDYKGVFASDTLDGNNNEAVYIFATNKTYNSIDAFANIYFDSLEQKGYDSSTTGFSTKSTEYDDRYEVEIRSAEDDEIFMICTYYKADNVSIITYTNLNSDKYLG